MVYWTDDLTRQLVALVRVNPGLYAKGVYKDLRARNQAWTQIASSLDPPCSGDRASRRFKNLRDVFVRELRKLETRKSIDSGFPSHPPSEMFSELLFLKDHINGRRCLRRSKLKLKQPRSFGIHLPDLHSECKPTTQETELDEQMSSSLSSQHLSIQSSLPAPVIIGDFTAVGKVDPGILTSQLTSSTAQHLTPSSNCDDQETTTLDRSYGTNDDYLRQCLDTLTELAAQICESLGSSPPLSPQASIVNPFYGVVSYGLGFVPEERRLRCVIDMLRVVESYRKGVKVIVLEEK